MSNSPTAGIGGLSVTVRAGEEVRIGEHIRVQYDRKFRRDGSVVQGSRVLRIVAPKDVVITMPVKKKAEAENG